MRYELASFLEKEMEKNKDIFFLTGDLGYKIFDKIINKYPDRAMTVGAAEQLMLGMAIGLAESGKIPFVYSITPFLLFRPFELIRNYLSNEHCNVKLIGCGRNNDYEHDGFSHWAGDDCVVSNFLNINSYWPNNKEELRISLESELLKTSPCYINITR
jgi:transketolase